MSMYTTDNVSIGDVVHFRILIAYRPHRSKSIVYGYERTGRGVLVSCNGVRKSFFLRWEEITRVSPAIK